MELKFREFSKMDVGQVIELFNELNEEGLEVSFSEIDKRDVLEGWIEDSWIRVYVAESNGKILGVFRGKKGNQGREHACFLTAAISRKYRGMKIGQRLTNYSLKQLKQNDVKIARAYVYSNNPSSVCTLLKCGFVASGSVHMHHFDNRTKQYVDDLIFHKIL